MDGSDDKDERDLDCIPVHQDTNTSVINVDESKSEEDTLSAESDESESSSNKDIIGGTCVVEINEQFVKNELENDQDHAVFVPVPIKREVDDDIDYQRLGDYNENNEIYLPNEFLLDPKEEIKEEEEEEEFGSAVDDLSYFPGLNILKENKAFKCNYCFKDFFLSDEITRHMRIVHIIAKSDNANKFMCGICWDEFDSQEGLKEHKILHDGHHPFLCGLCPKTFFKLENLRVHHRIHTGEKPYSCETCQKRFTTKSSLVTHTRIHTGERPYKCSHCSKTYNTSSYLNLHMMQHTNKSPYLCEACGRGFKMRRHLHRHICRNKGQGKNRGGFKYNCPKCARSFKYQGSLENHLLDLICLPKNLEKCNQCGKILSGSGSLTRHLRLHTGEKPFVCSICNAAYPDSTGVKSHMRSHTDDRPYKCDVCLNYFKSPNNLSRHRKNVHDIESPYSRSGLNLSRYKGKRKS